MYEPLTDVHIYTPGPVQMGAETLALGARQTPYFRNSEFSRILLECERLLLSLVNAPADSRCVFLTAAGTAAMEATVINLLGPERTAGIINGGSFGQRFLDICRLHGVPATNLIVDRDSLTDGVTLGRVGPVGALLVNAHETSVGHLYDLRRTGQWCRDHGALHIVDAISLFVTDPLDMSEQAIDALIISSHKGLALPPGLAMVVLSPQALAAVRPSGSFYLDFGAHLRDGTRGQTPFTPAVSIVLQLHQRLEQLGTSGLASEWQRVAGLAAHFRRQIHGLPLQPYSRSMPNAMTALEVTNGHSAQVIVTRLREEYRCIVAPNGGPLGARVFRVGHMGALDLADMDRLVLALRAVLGGSS